SNPDLPRRLQHGFPLTPYDRKTFYGGDAEGYTDYPAHGELAQVGSVIASPPMPAESASEMLQGKGPMAPCPPPRARPLGWARFRL
ncbi:hypothetical protein ABTE94_19905, partial [Acinetobacter baumannii]